VTKFGFEFHSVTSVWMKKMPKLWERGVRMHCLISASCAQWSIENTQSLVGNARCRTFCCPRQHPCEFVSVEIRRKVYFRVRNCCVLYS